METTEYCERAKEIKKFDETKAGVKGLIDSGITKIPRIFIHKDVWQNSTPAADGLQVPVIDLAGREGPRREGIVAELKSAAAKWGFFQIINHGTPVTLLEELLEGVRRFHEQPREIKEEWYSRDFSRPACYFSTADLKVTNPAGWGDALYCNFHEGERNIEALPPPCRYHRTISPAKIK